ncbi:MAG: host specificity protein, partial [Alphaproteobacteria bacterium]
AHLCALAGGVDAFCIGSEMRSLTQIRDGAVSYPAVQALKALAADVRSILGPGTKIGYAADWSEYFGHQPADGSGDVLFHLDPLWSDPNIDFVGIDNYMPLSDWRDGSGHLDAAAGSIYDLDYLSGNVAGGEGFDWYYASQADRDAQIRTPITDSAHGEDWVFRYKDILNWWSQPHHDRPGGVRSATPTSWVPQSKPVWFTEFGCPSVDKGTNQPNVFVDPKSSESFLPYYSSGARDDFIQLRYLQAQFRFWGDAANNPVSSVYGGPMVDLANAYAWAWDARPWPDFPARTDVWSDGPNYRLGHWLQGRVGSASLPELVAELCLDAGLSEIDVSELHGVVTGYAQDEPMTARQAIQPLMLGYRFDSTARDGKIRFRMRDAVPGADLTGQSFALAPNEKEGTGMLLLRGSQREMPDAVRIAYLAAENDYQSAAAEAVHPSASLLRAESGEMPVVLDSAEAQSVAERWLAELRVARDTAKFNLPPSMQWLEPGDVVRLQTGRADALFRIGAIEEQGARLVEAKRVEDGVYRSGASEPRSYAAPALPVRTTLFAQFLDLPLLRGDEVAHAPWLAVSGTPWPGEAACFASATDSGYTLDTRVASSSVVGDTLDALPACRPWSWYRGPGIQVAVSGGTLQSRSELDVLNGANAAAIRAPGATDWEIIQFRDAVLVGQQTYLLSHILRGQAGTEFLAGQSVPQGADFVLLDSGPVQIGLALSDRGLQRHYRVGPASRPYTDAAYQHFVESFAGIGLRPYAPVRLVAQRQSGGDIALSWIRRSRINGDSWAGIDIPLGEDLEAYEVRIVKNGAVLRTISAASPAATYSQAQQAADQIATPFEIEVAQLSAAFGAGPATRITFNG